MKNKFEFVLKGKDNSPLLMNSHSDGTTFNNFDQRDPSWYWQTRLELDKEGFFTIPGDNLTACLVRSGRTLKGTDDFCCGGSPIMPKFATSSLIDEESLIFSNNGQQINIAEFLENRHENFEDQRARVRKHGFDLWVKRVIVGKTKIVRVRPIFKNWELRGSIIVTDECASVLKEVFDNAGEHVGLGDWCGTGRFGAFNVELSKEIGLVEALA